MDLPTQLKKASQENQEIQQLEWEAYFDWYLEASKKKNTGHILCMQETNKNLSEIVTKLSLKSSTPEEVFPFIPPSFYPLNELPGGRY